MMIRGIKKRKKYIVTVKVQSEFYISQAFRAQSTGARDPINGK